MLFLSEYDSMIQCHDKGLCHDNNRAQYYAFVMTRCKMRGHDKAKKCIECSIISYL